MTLTDEDLVRRAVTYPEARRGPRPRWAYVKDVFGTGRTSSADLCRRFGLDPDETIGSWDDAD